MLTSDQYEKIKPYRHTVVVAKQASGQVLMDLASIYASHGRTPNTSCGACNSRMMDYFNSVIMEYETANPNAKS